MKKFAAIILSLTILFAIPCSALAQTANPHDSCDGAIILADGAEPRYEITCPIYAKHPMIPKGAGYVYSGSPSSPGTRLMYGYLTQCRGCSEVVVSEYHPSNTKKLGYYKVMGVQPSIPGYGTTVYLNGRSLDYFGGSVLNDSYWQGYEFRPA